MWSPDNGRSTLHPDGDCVLFSMVPWAQIRASQQTPIGYWVSKGLEPSRTVIKQCVNLFKFPALAYLAFPWQCSLPEWPVPFLTSYVRQSFLTWCRNTTPSTSTHGRTLCPLGLDGTQNSCFHCYFLFCKFQVYRKVEGAAQLTPICFSSIHQFLIFFHICSFTSCFFFSHESFESYFANLRLITSIAFVGISEE